MHGRSTHPGTPRLVAPATAPVPPTPLPPPATSAATPSMAAHAPIVAQHAPSPGERTTSPGATRGTVATLPHGPSGGAVVHLGRAGARVARDRPGGRPQIVSVPRRSRARSHEPYLVRILHAIGDRAPVVIAGLADERTALERELVRIDRRPERIIEDPHLDRVDEDLRGRLRALHSHPG